MYLTRATRITTRAITIRALINVNVPRTTNVETRFITRGRLTVERAARLCFRVSRHGASVNRCIRRGLVGTRNGNVSFVGLLMYERAGYRHVILISS